MLDDIKVFLIHFSGEKILSYERNQGTSISFDFLLFVAENPGFRQMELGVM